MLAKDIKIQNLKRQREFIREQLLTKAAGFAYDGDVAYTYVGYIFPEVKMYFEGEGFDVEEVYVEELDAKFGGKPIHLFTPRDNIKLTADEQTMAEEVEPPEDLFGFH